MEELLLDEGLKYYEIEDVEYSYDDVRIFIDCLMSGNISPEYILKCVTAIAIKIGLSQEEYMEKFIPEYDPNASEEDSQEEEEYSTSDFMNFVDISLVTLVFDKMRRSWIMSFRNLLVQQEQYELLHELKLEEKWNF
jgi:hypothetical protein